MATKRNELEREVLRISNPAGLDIEVEDIDGNVNAIRVKPMPHKSFSDILDTIKVLFPAGLEIGMQLAEFGAGIKQSVVAPVNKGADETQESSASNTVEEQADNFNAIFEAVLEFIPQIDSLIKLLIESGTTLAWETAQNKYHSIVVAQIAFKVITHNYGTELMLLLKGGLSLTQSEPDSTMTTEPELPITESNQ